MVARAAPEMPLWKTYLKRGSKQTFKRQAESVVLLAFKDSPCAVRN